MTYDARHQAMREATLLEYAEGHGGKPAPRTPAAVVSGSTTAAGPWRKLCAEFAAALGAHVYGGCPGGDHDEDTALLAVYRAAVQMAQED